MNITTDELDERTKDALNNLLASLEDAYYKRDIEFPEYWDDADRVALLQGRWLVASLNGDHEYLLEHTWDDACLGHLPKL